VAARNTAGIGIIIKDQTGVLIAETSTEEDHLWPITDLETKAITRTLQYLQLAPQQGTTTHLLRKLVIVTDSLASVLRVKSAVSNPKHKSTVSQFLLQAARDCKNNSRHPMEQITIHWIPGHKGMEGNERADHLAKKATDKRTIYSIHHEAARQVLKQGTHQIWAEKMRTSKSG
jgi:ribonuclease HI